MWAHISPIVAPDWARGYQRGDAYDCVHDTLETVLGVSPSALFGGQVSRDAVEAALRRLADARQASVGQWVGEYEDYELAPDDGEDGDIDGRSRKYTGIANYGMRHYVLHYRWAPTSGPFTRQDFRVVSQLGLAIWDTARLRTMNLAVWPRQHPVTIPNYLDHMLEETPGYTQLVAWRSVFLQELERLQGTAFECEVVPEAAGPYFRAWMRAGVVGERWEELLHTMSQTAGQTQSDVNYDGPWVAPEHFAYLNSVLNRTIFGMTQEHERYLNLWPSDSDDEEEEDGSEEESDGQPSLNEGEDEEEF